MTAGSVLFNQRCCGWGPTSIQAAAQQAPLADASWEVGSRPGYLGAGSAALDLGSTAVAKLGTQRQKLLGRLFRRQQPVREAAVGGDS